MRSERAGRVDERTGFVAYDQQAAREEGAWCCPRAAGTSAAVLSGFNGMRRTLPGIAGSKWPLEPPLVPLPECCMRWIRSLLEPVFLCFLGLPVAAVLALAARSVVLLTAYFGHAGQLGGDGGAGAGVAAGTPAAMLSTGRRLRRV